MKSGFVSIVGRTNVGKSSIINSLANAEIKYGTKTIRKISH